MHLFHSHQPLAIEAHTQPLIRSHLLSVPKELATCYTTADIVIKTVSKSTTMQ